MTNEEALEQLKINGTKEPLEISGSPTRMANYFKALDIASKAIKKQIAKKIDSFNCPICRYYLEDGEVHNYCPKCGQKLEL